MTAVHPDPSWIVPAPGFRLPAALRLGPVRLQVADLDRSIAYYQRVLGLRVLERDPGRVLLGPQDDATALVELRERPGAAPVPRRGRLGLFHFAVLLPERPALGRFLDHLSFLGVPAGMSDHLVSEAIYLSDPDGLGIEVYADRPRSSWRSEDSILAMATLPLDVQNLSRSSGGEPWKGAPPGTTMGHVHLSVSDLGTAGAFYHRALGLDQVSLDFPGALFLSAGGYHHHLGTNTWAARAPRPTDDEARLLEWTMLVPGSAEVEAAASSLGAAGYPVERQDGDAIAEDPWGTRVRLQAKPVS